MTESVPDNGTVQIDEPPREAERAATAARAGTSLGKGLELLVLLAESDGPLRIAEIAERAGRPKSTVHRLLATMLSMRVVEQTEGGRYAIGLRLFEIGSRAGVRISLHDVAAPELRDLSERLGETSHLGVLDDDQVVYVEKVEGSASIRMSSQVGRRNPLHCTGIGKALLAFADEERIASICDGGLESLTPQTIVAGGDLREELARTRTRGFSIDDEEVEPGLRCVGAPVLGAEGQPIAAISVAGPAMRMDLGRCREIGPELAAAAQRISRGLGHRNSNSGR